MSPESDLAIDEAASRAGKPRRKRVSAESYIGSTIGRWFIAGPVRRDRKGAALLFAGCACGTQRWVRATALQQGTSRSCGCVHAVNPGIGDRARTPTYRSWNSMIARCYQTGTNGYEQYGGRGIKVCDRWRASFFAFLRDMGERPAGCTLERIEVDDDYRPGNCRWATPAEQARNKRNNRVLTARGRSMTAADWAREAGLDVATLHGRLKRGLTHEQAIFTPPGEWPIGMDRPPEVISRCNPLMTLGDRTQSLKAWSAELGLPWRRVLDRVRSGWSDERALTLPRLEPRDVAAMRQPTQAPGPTSAAER